MGGLFSMSVRKRKWTTRLGEVKEAWIVDYAQDGQRHIETFERKKDADAYAQQVGVDVRSGVHTPLSKSITVQQAAEDWIKAVELNGRERGTVAMYRQHVGVHILPRLGNHKLASLTTPKIHAFADGLLADGVSHAMARKVLTSLKSLLGDAQRRGNVAQNVALNIRIETPTRGRQLQVGVDIPSPDEIRRLLAAAHSRIRALLVTAVFTGLRASELRGLHWEDIDLRRGELHVRRRADRYCVIGPPKSKAGERTIPLGPMAANTLREWKLARPDGELVFPTRTGHVEHQTDLTRKLNVVQRAAKLFDKDGTPKYGMHALRHFYASWCINRRSDGGLELPAKTVQARLGHASIVMTLDRYGHLFPRGDDGAELAEAERTLLGT
jgi:integrase